MSERGSGGRCAEWARDAGIDLAGTAPQCDIFVIVEHPLPWPGNLGDDPLLSALERAAVEAAGPDRSVRLQAVAVDPNQPIRRVNVFNRGGSPFTGYSRAEAFGIPAQLAGLVARLVAATPLSVTADRVTNVLVCTHGSRDACCGSFGTRLWLDVKGAVDGVRLWRTSHTGGHRFAPNAITFPDGNYWGQLDADLLRGVVDRTLPVDVAAAHLRGCAGFSVKVQVADRAIFALRGWGWLDCARFGEERSPNRVELCFESPDGERGSYLVWVDQTRLTPVPDCGSDPAGAVTFQPEFSVSRVEAST